MLHTCPRVMGPTNTHACAHTHTHLKIHLLAVLHMPCACPLTAYTHTNTQSCVGTHSLTRSLPTCLKRNTEWCLVGAGIQTHLALSKAERFAHGFSMLQRRGREWAAQGFKVQVNRHIDSRKWAQWECGQAHPHTATKLTLTQQNRRPQLTLNLDQSH